MHVHNSAVAFAIFVLYLALALTAGRLTAAYLTRRGGTIGELGKAMAVQF
jgi:hypothetical protein